MDNQNFIPTGEGAVPNATEQPYAPQQQIPQQQISGQQYAPQQPMPAQQYAPQEQVPAQQYVPQEQVPAQQYVPQEQVPAQQYAPQQQQFAGQQIPGQPFAPQQPFPGQQISGQPFAPQQPQAPKGGNKKIIIIVIAVVAAVALIVGGIFLFGGKNDGGAQPDTKPTGVTTTKETPLSAEELLDGTWTGEMDYTDLLQSELEELKETGVDTSGIEYKIDMKFIFNKSDGTLSLSVDQASVKKAIRDMVPVFEKIFVALAKQEDTTGELDGMSDSEILDYIKENLLDGESIEDALMEEFGDEFDFSEEEATFKVDGNKIIIDEDFYFTYTIESNSHIVLTGCYDSDGESYEDEIFPTPIDLKK